MDDAFFMKKAIDLAKSAAQKGNEPFGAVLVKDGEVVCGGENQINTANDPTFHAEIGLLRQFCRDKGVTDLREYTLYSSCEPCFMCSGAMVWAKLGRLVYAASNIDLGNILGKKGYECSRVVFENSSFSPCVTAGVLKEDALQTLRAYFNGKNNRFSATKNRRLQSR